MSKPSIHVAIALLFHQGKVLVGWRNENQHQGNKYEFPGGKVENGETPEQACRREIFEEVGIGIQTWHAFDLIHHDYDDIEVHLHLFHAQVPRQYLKDIKLPWTWYSREKLLELNFPKANQAILERLSWKHQIKINAELSMLDQLNDDQLLYWRIEDSTQIAHLDNLNESQLAKLIVNQDIWQHMDIHQQKYVAAIHYRQDQLLTLQKGQLPVAIRCIAACHDAVSIQRANQLGFDALLLSPVLETSTHPHTTPLGWEHFAELAKMSDIPVFALGGVKPIDLEFAKLHFAYGVAGISQF